MINLISQNTLSSFLIKYQLLCDILSLLLLFIFYISIFPLKKSDSLTILSLVGTLLDVAYVVCPTFLSPNT